MILVNRINYIWFGCVMDMTTNYIRLLFWQLKSSWRKREAKNEVKWCNWSLCQYHADYWDSIYNLLDDDDDVDGDGNGDDDDDGDGHDDE